MRTLCWANNVNRRCLAVLNRPGQALDVKFVVFAETMYFETPSCRGGGGNEKEVVQHHERGCFLDRVKNFLESHVAHVISHAWLLSVFVVLLYFVLS